MDDQHSVSYAADWLPLTGEAAKKYQERRQESQKSFELVGRSHGELGDAILQGQMEIKDIDPIHQYVPAVLGRGLCCAGGAGDHCGSFQRNFRTVRCGSVSIAQNLGTGTPGPGRGSPSQKLECACRIQLIKASLREPNNANFLDTPLALQILARAVRLHFPLALIDSGVTKIVEALCTRISAMVSPMGRGSLVSPGYLQERSEGQRPRSINQA